MIGIDGSYVFRFSLGSETDFIQEPDLIQFRLAEEAGGLLPSFEMIFTTDRDDILSKLNETTDFGVSYGRDTRELVDSSLAIMGLDSSKSGDGKRLISMKGLYSAIKYMTQTNLSLSENKSAIEVMRDIVSQHFDTDFNIEASEDSQIWVQPNQTDKSFVKELWMHSWLENSFCAIAISSDGKFICKDVSVEFENEFAYKFTNEARTEDPNAIVYDGDAALSVSRGFINNWVGYDREQLNFNFEDGTQALVKESIQPLLALTQVFAKREDVEKRFASQSVINKNTHANYWRAARKNLAYLVQFGETKVTLSFTGFFVPIRVLDVVMFKDKAVGQEGGSAEPHSGLYIVSKIIRNYQNRQFTTVVELSRESLNQIQGETVTETPTSGSLAVPASEEEFTSQDDQENEALNVSES